MQPVRTLMLAFLFLLGACTMESAIQSLTSEEDRAFAHGMVDNLRSGNSAWLESRFEPSLWAQSAKQVAGAPDLYPDGEAETRIVSFNVSSSMTNGRTERNKEFTMVTHGGGRWTVTFFRTYSSGGQDRVVEWRVTPHSSAPPELAMIETWDRMVPWIWAGVLIVLTGVVALVVWLVRRSRRRHDPLMGQGPAGP